MSQTASQPVTPPLTTTLSHKAHVAHQFEDAGQQKEAAALGMWFFLATEVLLFGGVFTAYIIYRSLFFTAFSEGSGGLIQGLGVANTVVLLTSSFFMVMAVHAAHKGDNLRIVFWIMLTILMGLAFLGVKAYEYTTDWNEHLVPFFGNWDDTFGTEHRQWVHQGINHQVRLFFIFYFIMTGIHALHMFAGAGVLGWIAWKAHKREFSADNYNPVEISGLYWHFVDIVWVFLLPSLYLIKPH